MPSSLRTLRVQNGGDTRGLSFSIPKESLGFLGAIRNIHVVTINPGAVRGNHYHQNHQEVLCLLYRDIWSLHWDLGVDTAIQHETFSGAGLLVVHVEPLAAHAVRNDGTADIYMVCFSNTTYNPENPDAHPRKVV
jgi:dTDP-4-dehydrorhamnose 3,5-epimerase-like enzyme